MPVIDLFNFHIFTLILSFNSRLMRLFNRQILRLSSTFFTWLLAFCLCFVPSLTSGAGVHLEDSLHKALASASDIDKKIQIYVYLAKLVKTRSVDSSLLFLEQAQKICRQNGSLESMGKIYRVKGEISRIQNKPEEAIRQFKIGEFIFRKVGNKRDQSLALNWIGSTYSDNPNGDSMPESFRYYLKSLEIAEEIKDTALLAMIYNNLGGVFSDAQNYNSCIDYYKKAQVLYDKWNDSINRATVYLNLGSAYVNAGKVDSSRSYFEKAIPIFSAKNKQLYLQMCLVLYSYSLLNEKRYTEAMNYAEKAFTYVRTRGYAENIILSKIVLSDIYYIMGRTSYETGNFTLSTRYLRRSYHLLDSLGESTRIMNVAEPLCMSYEKTGQVDSAIFFYRQVKMKSDTLLKNQIRNFGKLAAVQMEYEKDIKEKQMQLLYRETLQRRNLLIFIGSGFLLISLVIILILRLRLEQQKKKREESEKKRAMLEKQQALLEKETADIKLESQTREMTMNVMNLIRKNELMLEFSNRLVLIGKNTADDRTGSEIMQLINSMDQNGNNNVWEEFELRFNQVHNSYYERLLVRFPDLSPNDMKLCALLKLNLSTKEICELSGQRPSTLDTARYRLRKKLGLTPQDNLIIFLSQV